MKYRKFVIVAYNDEPSGPLPFGDDCFHCEVTLKSPDMTFDEWLQNYIKPAATAVFHASIPPMPHAIFKGAMNPAFREWEQKYFSGPVCEHEWDILQMHNEASPLDAPQIVELVKCVKCGAYRS
jgi:hypothetical protein